MRMQTDLAVLFARNLPLMIRKIESRRLSMLSSEQSGNFAGVYQQENSQREASQIRSHSTEMCRLTLYWNLRTEGTA